MPRSLFDQSLVSPRRNPRSRLTVAGSLCLHVAAIAALIVVPIVSGLAAPDVAAGVDRFVIASMPVPPPPPPQNPAPAGPPRQLPNPDAAPAVAPDRIPTEPPDLPRSGSGTPGPGALLGSNVGVPGGVPAPGQVIHFNPPALPVAPVRPGGDITAPDRLVYVAPVYPELPRVSRVEGLVIVEATIDEQGHVRNVQVLRSNPLFDAAAIAAVRQWRYTPTKLNGVPVPVLLTVTVRFALR